MKHLDRANALVAGDWSSLRDVIRDMAEAIDALKKSQDRAEHVVTDAGPAPYGSPPVNKK